MNASHTLALGAAVLAALLSGCATVEAAPTEAQVLAEGEHLYTNYCTPCHGTAGDGEGSTVTGHGAPGISGLPEWYVLAQVGKFRDGVRGTHFDDIAGMRMRPMTLTLTNQGQVDAVSSYVASLPAKRKAPELTGGDAVKGKAAFATCSACHAADGSGNEALKAPPIAGADDWYLRTQINNFKHGVRGANPDDTSGATMAPMAKTLADDQAVLDVIAYITSLNAH